MSTYNNQSNKYSLEVQHLASKYLKAKDAYHNGVPLMSDNMFDQDECLLEKLAPDHPALQMVGSPARGLESAPHFVPMLSTDKALDKEALQAWADRKGCALVGTMKLDGAACDLHYVDGHLVRAASRGDGHVGTDITAKARYIVLASLPETNISNDIHIRGELVISFGDFDKLNEYLQSGGHQPMSNPRNAAAGIGVLEDAIIPEKLAFLSFVAYRVVVDGGEHPFKDCTSELQWLHAAGFEIPMSSAAQGDGDKSAQHAASVFDQARSGYKYPVDGIVFRVRNEGEFIKLGTTAKFHRGAVAYKFAAEEAVIILQDVEWSPGSVDISPVAIFDPVLLDGAILGRASLHSVKNMLYLGAVPGAELKLVRSGGVIPLLKRLD